jgi:hypothetical protein
LEQRIGKTKADKTHWLMDVEARVVSYGPRSTVGPSWGRDGNAAQHSPETGSKLLSIHSEPSQRREADGALGGADQTTCGDDESQFSLGIPVTEPDLLRSILESEPSPEVLVRDYESPL